MSTAPECTNCDDGGIMTYTGSMEQLGVIYDYFKCNSCGSRIKLKAKLQVA